MSTQSELQSFVENYRSGDYRDCVLVRCFGFIDTRKSDVVAR